MNYSQMKVQFLTWVVYYINIIFYIHLKYSCFKQNAVEKYKHCLQL